MEALFPLFGRPLEADTVGYDFMLRMIIYIVNLPLESRPMFYLVFSTWDSLVLSNRDCVLQPHYRKISVLTSSGVFAFLVSPCCTSIRVTRSIVSRLC